MSEIAVREGKKEDFSMAGVLIESFVEEYLKYYGFAYDNEKAMVMMSSCVDDSMVLFSGDNLVGVIAGIKFPNYIDNSSILSETIWYVLPMYRKYGLRLYYAFVKMAKAKGYHKLIMTHIGNEMSRVLEKFYINQGMTLFEQHFIKEL